MFEGFWDEQKRVMSRLKHGHTPTGSDAGATEGNEPRSTTEPQRVEGTRGQGHDRASSEEDLLRTGSSLSNTHAVIDVVKYSGLQKITH